MDTDSLAGGCHHCVANHAFVLAHLLGIARGGATGFWRNGPEDLILLMLIAEASDIGLAPNDSGFWGAITSIVTLLTLVYGVERLPFLRQLLDPPPVYLMRRGIVDEKTMRHYLIEQDDLLKAARQYGHSDLSAFKTIILEGDGSISAILKSRHQSGPLSLRAPSRSKL